MWRGIICASVFIFASWIACGQTTESNLQFEVASVKSSAPGTEGGRIQFLPGGTFRATNVPLIYLLEEIYQIRRFQIVGDRRWMSIIADGYNARYDIEARSNDGGVGEVRLRELVKGLLSDRFQLAVHRETRELPVFALLPAKGRTRLQPVTDNGKPRGSGRVAFLAEGWIQGTNVAMPALIQALSELVNRPVVDKTGFTDAFDFKLTFTSDSGSNTSSDGTCPPGFARFRERRGLKPEAESCPSIFTAVQDQLGLRLDSRKDAVGVLVVDHVERPSPN
jgi:bla regulator protein BlaR1